MDNSEFGPYSYQQLKEMRCLEFDDVYVRSCNETDWIPTKNYVFTKIVNKDYKIDEYGQIVRTNIPNTNTTSTLSSTSKNSSSSDENGWTIFGKVLLTVLIAGGAIAIGIGTIGIGTPLAYGAYLLIKQIWSDN